LPERESRRGQRLFPADLPVAVLVGRRQHLVDQFLTGEAKRLAVDGQ
jgi:hypothetical protein